MPDERIKAVQAELEARPPAMISSQNCTRHRDTKNYHDSSPRSSSSGDMPFQEHSCLHDFLPLMSVLRTLPHRMEADFALADVQFDCAKPSPPRSTSSAMPLGWRTVDGCPKSMWVVLRWVGTANVAKQTQSSCLYRRSDWRLVGWFCALLHH